MPLLKLNKLNSRQSSRATSTRSEISVLSLPPSRKTSQAHLFDIPVTSKKGQEMANEWGIKNPHTIRKLMQRAKKFSDPMTAEKKRKILRKRILDSTRQFLIDTKEPTLSSIRSSSSDVTILSDVVYQWDDRPLHRASSRRDKNVLPTRIYRNPTFSQPANNMRLPPIFRKNSDGVIWKK